MFFLEKEFRHEIINSREKNARVHTKDKLFLILYRKNRDDKIESFTIKYYARYFDSNKKTSTKSAIYKNFITVYSKIKREKN